MKKQSFLWIAASALSFAISSSAMAQDAIRNIQAPASSAGGGGLAAIAVTPVSASDIQSIVAAEGTASAYRTWLANFAGQEVIVSSTLKFRIAAGGVIEKWAYGSTGWTTYRTPLVGDGGRAVVSASCTLGGGSGASIASGSFVGFIPEGNAGTGILTGWKLVYGSNTGVTNCADTYRVRDYWPNGAVGGYRTVTEDVY